MSLPSNFALLALSPTIRDNAAFLFLQSGSNGLIDIMIQGATGSPVNIMQINTGVNIANRVFVNGFGNDNTGRRESVTLPFQTIDAGIAASTFGDTVEIFPGSYVVTGNLFKDGISLYFHQGSSLDLQGAGKLHIPEIITSYNIFGQLYLQANGTESNPIKVLGGPCTIEYNLINCGTGTLLVSGTTAGGYFKGISANWSSTDVYPSIAAPRIVLDNPSLVIFEKSSFYPSIAFEIKKASNSYPTVKFEDCIFNSTKAPSDPCPFAFSGKFEINKCIFNGGYSIFSTPSGQSSQLNNNKFQGGVITSGSNYFENSVFDSQNYNYYPNFSLITNQGGHSVFTNCYARNFNNTNYVAYTFRSTGSASGAVNFNINNHFSSFKNVDTNISINYGSFVYNLNQK